MKRIIAAVFFALVLCGAKASFGTDFTDTNLPKLEVGKTTLPEAVALLGTEPTSSAAGRSGAMGYTWQFVNAKTGMFSGKVSSNAKSVTLVFSTDGTFQRILRIQGITLPAADAQRLMTDPAAAQASSTP